MDLFQASLNAKKSHPVPVRMVRDDSKARTIFTRWTGEIRFGEKGNLILEKKKGKSDSALTSGCSLLVDDRSENTFSYYEFLQVIYDPNLIF